MGAYLNNLIVNTIIATSIPANISSGYQCVARIDQLSPQPGIGWSTVDNCSTFVAPTPSPTPSLAPSQAIANATLFGQNLVAQFESWLNSSASGATSAQIATIDSQFQSIKVLLLSGSLQSALTAIEAVTPGTIVTSAILTSYENQLSTYISANGI